MKLIGARTLLAAIGISVVFEEVLSNHPEVTDSIPMNDTSAETGSWAVLPKTVFSSNMRLVLAVGVEGTGHGYFCQVDDHLFDNNPTLTRLSSKDYLSAGRFHIRSSMGSTARHYSDLIDQSRTAMRTLAKVGADLPPPGTMMLMHGWYSYPDGIGKEKALMYLDLRVLAEVAEAEGVDFRVVYLRRPAKDMLLANTVHRRFQK